MFEVTVTGEFSGAHNLRGYKGKCEELHGHNWKVEVSAQAAQLNKQGMVVDFIVLKAKLKEATSALDHTYLNDIPYFKKQNPTSENIARFIYEELSPAIGKKIRVSVWETDTSCASYSR
jgi:6-pyruvoyltetrahydropterin/6-carboxytetrahydropterin synthase